MPTPSRPEITVFGEAMIELSELKADQARLGVAGDCFNVSVYMARAGLGVTFASAVGDDPMSDRVVDAFQAEGIDTSLVLQTPRKAPGLYAVNLDDQGERSFTYWRENSAARTFFQHPDSATVQNKVANASHLYLSGITLSIFSERDLQTLIDLVARAADHGCTIVFDTNYRPNGWHHKTQARAAIGRILPYVTTALPTLEDEMALYGFETVQDCVAFWQAAGAKEIVVKSGPKGAYTQADGWIAPPQVIKPTDTTGAGDSFNGAYLAARLRGHSITQAVTMAHQLAGQVIKSPGAILPRLPSSASSSGPSSSLSSGASSALPTDTPTVGRAVPK